MLMLVVTYEVLVASKAMFALSIEFGYWMEEGQLWGPAGSQGLPFRGQAETRANAQEMREWSLGWGAVSPCPKTAGVGA